MQLLVGPYALSGMNRIVNGLSAVADSNRAVTVSVRLGPVMRGPANPELKVESAVRGGFAQHRLLGHLSCYGHFRPDCPIRSTGRPSALALLAPARTAPSCLRSYFIFAAQLQQSQISLPFVVQFGPVVFRQVTAAIRTVGCGSVSVLDGHRSGRFVRDYQQARLGWAPALDRSWLTQVGLAGAARTWGAAVLYAEADASAANAMRAAEDRLRSLLRQRDHSREHSGQLPRLQAQVLAAGQEQLSVRRLGECLLPHVHLEVPLS